MKKMINIKSEKLKTEMEMETKLKIKVSIKKKAEHENKGKLEMNKQVVQKKEWEKRYLILSLKSCKTLPWPR